ncbi:MAG: cyclase family protein [Acidobacteriota bacterium]|nr:cyclase family protein [Acidobacteriota bacterium]
MQLFDISRNLSSGIDVWPGDPEYRPRWAARIRDGAPSNVSAIDLCVHTGTHIDAPFHLDDSGNDIAGIPPQYFIGAARVVSLEVEPCIRASDLSPLDWDNVERVLFKTRNSRKPENSIEPDFIYLSADAAAFLAERRLLLVGIDAPSVDAADSEDLPSHRLLLRQEIVILEGARLEGVPPGDYELICLPLKLTGLDGSPVRAILRK